MVEFRFLPKVKKDVQRKDFGCETGVWRNCECQKDISMRNNSADYWTTWSALMLSIAILAAIVVYQFLPRLQLLTAGSYLYLWEFLYIYLVAACANSLAVLISSQLIISRMNPLGDLEDDAAYQESKCPYTIDGEIFRSVQLTDVFSHIAPGVFATLLLLMLVKKVRSPIKSKASRIVFATFVFLLIGLIYMLIPFGPDGVTGITKLTRVYFNEDTAMMFSLPVSFLFWLVVIVGLSPN